MSLLPSLRDRIASGDRLSYEEWLSCTVSGPSVTESDTVFSTDELCQHADALRARLHPHGLVSYIIDRNINYSNVCTCVCNFCAFYRPPGDDEGYVLSYEDIYRKVEETIELGGSGILMQGGLHPDLPLKWYTNLLTELKTRYGIHLHCFSPPEILGFHEVTGMSYRDILEALKDAGLDSIPGGGGEILVDEIRRKRRTKCDSQEWLDIMAIAHEVGFPTTATMMFAQGETETHRLQHLEKLRQLQDRTGGFVAFIPWTFQPDGTPLGKLVPDRMPVDEYLRWLAISRLYFDNIENVQVSWLTQGIDGGRRGLCAGANDIGSIMIEENVISPAGATHRADENLLRDTIEAAGFRPIKRNAAYRWLEKPPATAVLN